MTIRLYHIDYLILKIYHPISIFILHFESHLFTWQTFFNYIKEGKKKADICWSFFGSGVVQMARSIISFSVLASLGKTL